jgi:GT2 family glycosyltransferase
VTPGVAFAAVVVNHNTRELLRECLESLREEGPAETVVVERSGGWTGGS